MGWTQWGGPSGVDPVGWTQWVGPSGVDLVGWTQMVLVFLSWTTQHVMLSVVYVVVCACSEPRFGSAAAIGCFLGRQQSAGHNPRLTAEQHSCMSKGDYSV